MVGSYGREVIYLIQSARHRKMPSENRPAGHDVEFSLTASGEDRGAVFPMEL